jgi:hypothetical protein
MHPIQDLFLESFSYELQFDMHFYMHSCLHKSFYSCKKWVSQVNSNNPSDHTPLSDPNDSDLEIDPVRAAIEFHSYGEESPTVLTQLRGLLFHLGITRAPEYRVKVVPRLGCMEFTCTMEVFDGQEVVGKHACPTLM